jgi:hypothetical protein
MFFYEKEAAGPSTTLPPDFPVERSAEMCYKVLTIV